MPPNKLKLMYNPPLLKAALSFFDFARFDAWFGGLDISGLCLCTLFAQEANLK